jgi:hypothetical protein
MAEPETITWNAEGLVESGCSNGQDESDMFPVGLCDVDGRL